MAFGIVAAVATVVGAGSSIMGSIEAKKQADKQYEASQAAFNNEIEAAITNSEWQLIDNATQYNIDNTKRDSDYSISIDTLWDRANAQVDQLTGKASVDSLAQVMSADVDSDAALNALRVKSKALLADAKVNMEYTVAMSKNAQDYNSQKAMLESIELAGIAQATVAFLDQDIHNIREQITRVSEEVDVATSSAMGKLIARTASSLTAGNSKARTLMDTIRKADQLKQQKVEEQRTALQKAYATQEKTAQTTNMKIQTAYNEALNQNKKITSDTIASLAQTVSSTDIKAAEMLESTQNTITTINDSLSNNLATIEGMLNVQTDNVKQVAAIEADQLTGMYNNEKIAAKANYEYSTITNMRNREKSYETAATQFDGMQWIEGIERYTQFTESPEYSKYKQWADANGVSTGIKSPKVNTQTIGADHMSRLNSTTGMFGDTIQKILDKQQGLPNTSGPIGNGIQSTTDKISQGA